MADFNEILENDLDNFLNKVSRERYDNDIRKIQFLNDSLNISLACIGIRLNGRTGASVHNLKTKKNKLSEKIQSNLDGLIKYALSRLKQKSKTRSDLSSSHKKNIEALILEGNELVEKRKTVVTTIANQVFIGRG
jgi:hypothetical protein